MDHLDPVDILLVEDSQFDAELTLRSLAQKHIANPIRVVIDGAEALDYLFARGNYADFGPYRLPKIILLDLKLPKLNGLEVLAAIKSDERLRTIPVVMVTSSREDPDIQKAYSLGANSYVIKPIDFDSFSATIGTLGMYWLLVNQPPI
ncbi:MAG TPA: response regulator [bacterium]|nr:response regulator [bacterium]